VPENTSYNTSRSTPPTDESSVNIHAHQSALPWHSLSKPIQSNTHVLPCMGTYFFFIYLFTHALCRVTRVSMYGYLFFFLFTHALCRVTRVSMYGYLFFFFYLPTPSAVSRVYPCPAAQHAAQWHARRRIFKKTQQCGIICRRTALFPLRSWGRAGAQRRPAPALKS
jgi:hypothetical protein